MKTFNLYTNSTGTLITGREENGRVMRYIDYKPVGYVDGFVTKETVSFWDRPASTTAERITANSIRKGDRVIRHVTVYGKDSAFGQPMEVTVTDVMSRNGYFSEHKAVGTTNLVFATTNPEGEADQIHALSCSDATWCLLTERSKVRYPFSADRQISSAKIDKAWGTNVSFVFLSSRILGRLEIDAPYGINSVKLAARYALTGSPGKKADGTHHVATVKEWVKRNWSSCLNTKREYIQECIRMDELDDLYYEDYYDSPSAFDDGYEDEDGDDDNEADVDDGYAAAYLYTTNE